MGTGGTFSFFTAALRFVVVVAAGFFVAVTFRPFAGGFVTMVVPAEVLLASELLPLSVSLPFVAAAPRLVWVLLAVRFPAGGATVTTGLTGLAGRDEGFSEAYPAPLMGERGSVRELWDLGESTVDGTALRETVRATLVLAVVVDAAAVFARFFGLVRSGCDACEDTGRFSLSFSAVDI